MKPLRFGIGGIRHETNTFSPVLTGYDDFVFHRGEAAVAGGLEPFQHMEGLTLLPTFVASAMPNGMVRQAAYSQLKAELLAALQSILPLDGLYLDLHGAMEVETIGDAEGDLVTAVRQLVGPDTLISVSLDLHGNISPTLVETADILTAFRTAPHRDYEETRRRAFDLMLRSLQNQIKPVSVMIKLPLLLAGESAVTEREPAQSLYARLAEIDQVPGMMNASLLIGCAWTDSAYTTASVIAVAEQDHELAQQQAAGLARQVWGQRHNFDFGVETATIDEAIRRAMAAPERPVFISDSGDNVTAGGAGDLPLFIERLLALGARDALVAGLADPEAVRRCLAAGEGATVELSIGGKLDQLNSRPLDLTGRVVRLSSDPDDPHGPPALALVQARCGDWRSDRPARSS